MGVGVGVGVDVGVGLGVGLRANNASVVTDLCLIVDVRYVWV